MNGKLKSRLFWIIGGLAAVSVIFLLIKANSGPGKLDEFAKCLKEKEAVFYGAFWCPHCRNQKSLFGRSAKLLPYVECSTPDGNGQLAICREKKIESYPTWEFSDSSRESGEIPLERLSLKTGCFLPQ